MNAQEDKKLWDLLGNATPAADNPLFVQSVLQALAQEEAGQNAQKMGKQAPPFLSARPKRRAGLFYKVSGLAAVLVVGLSSAWMWLGSDPQNLVATTETPSLEIELSEEEYQEQMGALRSLAGTWTGGEDSLVLMEIASCNEQMLSEEEIQEYLAYL